MQAYYISRYSDYLKNKKVLQVNDIKDNSAGQVWGGLEGSGQPYLNFKPITERYVQRSFVS